MLRAVAVVLVVVYHYSSSRLPGGFVGVDVFFVVSGFLITAHLRDRFERDGRVSLPAFWARRARRLLPASLFVLAASTIGTLFFIPVVQWQQAFREIAASAGYVQNWLLASDSIDYLAAENAPSPVQHFWSLSVEEQFYLTVPVLLVLAALVSRRLSATAQRRALVVTLAIVVVASLIFSISLTFSDPGPAYFVTPTRAWEFAAGGLLAFAIGWADRVPPFVRAIVAWTGWVLIAVSALVITASTPFPGYAALLPVGATLAVIWAGRPPVRWAPDRLLVQRPIVALGDISYSVYLWHWPLLIFAESKFGPALSTSTKAALIGIMLVLAWATTRFIENPVRRGAFLTARRPAFTFAATAAAMVIVIVPSVSGWYLSRNAATAELVQAASIVAEGGPCIGAGSRDPANACPVVEYDQLIPDPSAAVDDKSAAYDNGCIAGIGLPGTPLCTAGPADGPVRVALIGDSHAVQWLPALQAIAAERGWAITTFFRSACPFSTADNLSDLPNMKKTCLDWNEDVRERLATSDPFDLVFVSNKVKPDAWTSDAAAIAGYREAWAPLIDRGSEIVVIRDTPRVVESTVACVEANEPDTRACDVTEESAFPGPDPEVAATVGLEHAQTVDLNDYFCWDGTCKTAIGGVVTFRDTHHITATLATTFGPVIGRQLDAFGL